MSLAPTLPVSLPDNLEHALYRFGWIALPSTGEASSRPSGVPVGWTRVEHRGWTVWAHPELPVVELERGDDAALLLGHVFGDEPGGAPAGALDEILAAPTTDRLLSALDGLSGRFALFVHWGGKRWLFHDPVGSRSVFYGPSPERGIASHSELLAHATSIEPSAERLQFIDSDEYQLRVVRYMPGDWTRYDDIYALVPNNLLDLAEWQTHRYWPREDRREVTVDEFIAAFDRHMRGLATFLRPPQRPIVGLTGGIDTRTILAAFRRLATPFRTVTWLGNWYNHKERPSIDGIAERLDGEHRFLESPAPATDHGRAVMAIAHRNTDHVKRDSHLSVSMEQAYGQRDDVFVRGWGGEIMRGFYNLSQRPIGSLQAQEFWRVYHTTRAKTTSGAYAATAKAAFEGFCERANYSDQILTRGFDINDLFYWEHRMGTWGALMLNDMDVAALSLIGLNDRRLYEAAFGVPSEQRLSKSLLAGVVRKYDPALADVPVV